jgi:RND family efflux transporter MFP subunit
MKAIKHIVIPLAILIGSAGITAGLIATKKKPEAKPAPVRTPLVQTVAATSTSETLMVRAQGTVMPRTETVLFPEVSGRVLNVSPVFYSGGHFEKGEMLIQIDPSNYQSAVAQAEFNLASAKLKLEQERARAAQAVREWRSLSNEEPPALAARQPQLAAEEANVAWAEQALERARRDLERTRIVAPYAGMVREKRADVGQYVAPGTALGTIFAADVAEVRLPLSTEMLAYLDLPQAFRGESTQNGARVTLKARFGGTERSWPARIVRTEGVIDPATRMISVVAQIDDPYGRNGRADAIPLPMGLFVQAEIEGRQLDNVVTLPRQTLRSDDAVLVVDESGKLRSRRVEVVKLDERRAYIGSGLQAGEIVCLTALDFVVDGMSVKIAPGNPGYVEAMLPATEAQVAEAVAEKGARS